MKPKILILFGGLPHYYNPILERLNEQYELVALVPNEKSLTFGAGVHEDYQVSFRIIRVQEFYTFYNKVFVRNMAQIIHQEKPAIIIASIGFSLGFLLYPRVTLALKKNRVKLCLKSIPFREPLSSEAILHYYKIDLAKNKSRQLLAKGLSYLRSVFFVLATRFTYRLADFFVVYTKEGKDVYGSYGANRENIFVIYNSPDTDAIFRTKQIISKTIQQPTPNQVLHVGRLVAWKRVDMLLEAIAALSTKIPDISLVVVGEGPEKEKLILQAAKLGISDRVRFDGAIYEAEKLGQIFSSSALYVLAGMGGLSINEAMAYGLPVICSICDGTEKDLVRDGYNGYIFEEGQLNSLINAIELVLADPKQRQQMADNSLRIIREEINIQRVVNEYLNAFASVLKTS